MSNPTQPTLTVTDGVARLTFPTDDYRLDFANLARTKYGSLLANVTACHGTQVLHMARFDVLNQRDQEHFHQRCLSVNGTVADWQSRLQSAIPGLEHLLTTEADPNAGAVWDQAITAEDFLLQDETEIQADAKDLVIPGCITLIAAPRASGKTLVALFLALALAQGGLFRGERVPQRRVLLVDRDNPPALIRKRLRWLGAHKVIGLKVLTRDQAPPLTDAAAWASFPVDQYDVVIVDSIGAATEGVSEKEGKQTQQYLATLKDVARRGPAILALDNTNKAALNYRGRGEKGDAVDILYECRNVTGWTPAHGGDWWEDLPDFGEHTWQQRASRRKGQQVLQIAFIPSKFRLGAEPEPFALEIDTRQEPWTLVDITKDIATAGERAAQETRRQEQAKLDNASHALVKALQAHQGHSPILKQEAEALLQGQGLSKRVARTLLEHGGNRDIFREGWWVLRPIPGERGHPIGVYLAGEEDGGRNNLGQKSPSPHGAAAVSISATRSTPSGRNTLSQEPAETLHQNGVLFRPPHGYEVAEIDSDPDKHICGSQEGGLISATKRHSNTTPPAAYPVFSFSEGADASVDGAPTAAFTSFEAQSLWCASCQATRSVNESQGVLSCTVCWATVGTKAISTAEDDASPDEEEPWPEPPAEPLTPEERFGEVAEMYDRQADDGPPPAMNGDGLGDACPECHCIHLLVLGAYRQCQLCDWKWKTTVPGAMNGEVST